MKNLVIYKDIKKILLIFVGIILSLVILEIGLQITSFTLSIIKKYKNKIVKDTNTITILCLGESTTDGHWPPILQQILDKKSKKKFIVVDEGIYGTNTRKIAEKIESNLIKYNPDIIICMMGINDVGLGYKKYRIKILSLFSLIVSHIKQHFYYTEEDILYLDSLYRKDLSKNKFIKIAYKIFNRTGYENYHICMTLFDYIKETNYKDKKSIEMMDKLIKRKKQFNPHEIIDIAKFFKLVKKYNTQQIKEFIIKNKNKIEYDKHLTETLLKEYNLMYLLENIKNNEHYEYKKNIKRSLNLKREVNRENYQYIISEIYKFKENALIISMQYPTLSVEKLKLILKDNPYYDKLVFVSNEENFKQALKTHKSEEIFRDMFAGTFGHCTEFGNTLIAENVAETILKLYN